MDDLPTNNGLALAAVPSDISEAILDPTANVVLRPWVPWAWPGLTQLQLIHDRASAAVASFAHATE